MEENNQDMFKMYEQAMAMSKMFNHNSDGNGEEGKTEEENADKFKQAMDMMQMFKMFNGAEQGGNESGAGQPGGQRQPHVNTKQYSSAEFFDDSIHTPALRSIKAAIPYLDYKYQKNIGIFIKCIELQKLLEMYSNRAIGMQGKQDKDWRRGMLRAIRPYMDEEKKNKVDMLLKCIDMREIMWSMRAATK